MDNNRPQKDQYYLNIAKEVAQRCTCFRYKAGAIIVREDQIVAAGYIGAPRKTKDCIERGFCLRNKLKIPHGHRYELCRSVHAEMNAIINAARAGVSLFGGDMYCYGLSPKDNKEVDSFPCFLCKKMIINAGLNRVVCFTKEKNIKIFNVQDWTKEWQEKDIIDDKQQYGADANIKENLK